MRLTLVSFNHTTLFLMLPVDADGHVRITAAMLRDLFGIRRGDCIFAR